MVQEAEVIEPSPWGVPASRLAAGITQRAFRQKSLDIKNENGLCQFHSSLEGMPARIGESEANHLH